MKKPSGPTLFPGSDAPDNDEPRYSNGPAIEKAPRSLAGASGPRTSRMAAEEIVAHLGALHRVTIDAVRANPDLTAMELSKAMGFPDPRKLNRRLPELRDARWVEVSGERRCQITGRVAQTWRAVR